MVHWNLLDHEAKVLEVLAGVCELNDICAKVVIFDYLDQVSHLNLAAEVFHRQFLPLLENLHNYGVWLLTNHN